MRYWVSWVQPTEDFRPMMWPLPSNMDYWCSGYDSDGMPILCALIDAESDVRAREQIAAYWPETTGVNWRTWDEKPDDWTPGDRFPLENLKPTHSQEAR